VRKAIHDPSPPQYTRVVLTAKPVLDPFAAIIDRWLDDDLSSPKKQRHTARRIYHRLVEEHGFSGGESTVRRYVRQRRPREREVYIPVDTHGQSPWHFTGQARLDLNPDPPAISHTR